MSTCKKELKMMGFWQTVFTIVWIVWWRASISLNSNSALGVKNNLFHFFIISFFFNVAWQILFISISCKKLPRCIYPCKYTVKVTKSECWKYRILIIFSKLEKEISLVGPWEYASPSLQTSWINGRESLHSCRDLWQMPLGLCGSWPTVKVMRGLGSPPSRELSLLSMPLNIDNPEDLTFPCHLSLLTCLQWNFIHQLVNPSHIIWLLVFQIFLFSVYMSLRVWKCVFRGCE